MRLGQRAWNDHRLQHGSSRVPGGLEAALDRGLSIIENAPVNSRLSGHMADPVPEANDRRMHPAAPARAAAAPAAEGGAAAAHPRRPLPPRRAAGGAALAAEFATSQGPVREALRELEATGLVTNVPRRGTYVAEVARRRPARDLRRARRARGAGDPAGHRPRQLRPRGAAGSRSTPCAPRRGRATSPASSSIRSPSTARSWRRPATGCCSTSGSSLASRPAPPSPCSSTGSTCRDRREPPADRRRDRRRRRRARRPGRPRAPGVLRAAADARSAGSVRVFPRRAFRRRLESAWNPACHFFTGG